MIEVEKSNIVEIEVLLIDNTGQPVKNQLITISLNGTDITAVITTADNGTTNW